MGATPQSKGLVRVRAQVCLRTPAPIPFGVAPDPSVPRGKAIERRWRRCRAAVSNELNHNAMWHIVLWSWNPLSVTPVITLSAPDSGIP